MTPSLTLTPGAVSLADWRAIAQGAAIILAPEADAVIRAGADAIAAILAQGQPVYGINTGFGKLASVRIADADLAQLQYNLVVSHASGVGEPLPAAVTRLTMALKLANLGQGASGVRLETAHLLVDMLARDVLPLIPAQGSVGASGDLAPLAHMTAAMIGVGWAFYRSERLPAAEALARAGLQPATLAAKEGLALLNGTQFCTANALYALFAAETLFQAALIGGALTTDAAKGSDGPFDPRIHALRRHAGQIEVAGVLRRLMVGSAIRASHRDGDDRIQDPYCLRCQPQVMGAALDLLRAVAATLAIEANGVSDNPLIFADTAEAVSGGNFHAEPVAFAADIMALAICEIGSLAERRISLLVDPVLSRLPAFLTPRPGLNSGFMIPQVTAAALVAENKQMAHPACVDSIPTSANQEDHVSMGAHGAYRLHRMTRNLAHVLAIELLAACQGCDFLDGLVSSPPLERVRALVRRHVPGLSDDRFFAPDLAIVAELIQKGDLTGIAALENLPGLELAS